MSQADDDHAALPGYVVLGELGRGGFGVVLLARHVILDRLVAVKQIPTGMLTDADAVARFRREAVVLSGLDHPNIVGVYDFQVGDRGAVLVMEYVPGRSLRDVLDQGTMTPLLSLRILSDVAAALDAAHRVGVVHRDVKPGNVFLAPDGSSKLGDFGIARAADPDLFRTAAGMLIGTPAYLPPEAVQTEREPDHHGDDYSLAVMAYEMLVGVLPFRGEGLSLLGQHGFATAASPQAIHPNFPEAAAAALLAGLAKDPERRLSASDLTAALRRIPDGAWAGFTPLPPEHAVPGLTTFAPAARPTPAVIAPARRRRPRLLLVTSVVAGLAAAAVAVALLSGDDVLDVREVTLAADRASGSCPAAEYLITARIETNGEAGRLSLQWTQPDGDRTDPTEVVVPDGQSSVEATLQFSVRGNTELTGDAVLHLLGSDPRDSPPLTVTYSCPAG